MTRLRAAMWLCLVCACSMAGLGRSAVGAASPNPATVSVARNVALNAAVWPADFNGDGITDLVASDTTVAGHPEYVLVALGKGDGTFGSPIRSSTTGEVLAIGDFNGDGKRDVLVRQIGSSGSASALILPGKGDGTFASPIVVGTFDGGVTFARTADLNGDHVMDVIICDGSTVYVYPGNGDFTFGTPAQLATSYFLLGGAVADFNGDGKPDIAVVSHDGGYALRIFLNQGALNFTFNDTALDRRANDVVAADLDKDGHIDLVVATADSAADNPDAYVAGYAYVMFGHGDGTFSTPVQYQTAAGAWQVVVGDFTRDGMLDIATANRSAIYRDDCTISLKTWDSVSILPGNGDGTFAAASSFSLGDQSKLFDDRFRNTVMSLNTSDVNGDGATDLIASWGAILRNNPPDPNWPPAVTANSTAPVSGDPTITLTAPASDSDQDLLTYSWIDSAGTTSIPPVPIACVQPSTGGVHTFTVTVNDQHGHTASSSVTVDMGSVPGGGSSPSITISAPTSGTAVTAGTPYTIAWSSSFGGATVTAINVVYQYDTGDGGNGGGGICTNLPSTATQCTWNDPEPIDADVHVYVYAMNGTQDVASADSGQFSIVPATTLSNGWFSVDVGQVGVAGSASFDGSQYDGDKDTVSGGGADIWGTADAFHYAWTWATGDFQITMRVNSLDAVNAWTKGGLMMRENVTAPGSRHASIFATPAKGVAYQRRISTNGTSLNTSAAGIVAPVWLRMVRVQDTIYAHYRQTPTTPWTLLGSDSFSELPATVAIGIAVTSHEYGVLATGEFAGLWLAPFEAWTSTAVGSGTGSFTTDGTNYTVKGSGADIWGTADAFEYVQVPTCISCTITVRVQSVGNTNAWSKAGVMIRESLDANATHVDAVVTPGKGIAMQYRSATGGASASAAIVSGAAPVWLRMHRGMNTNGTTDAFLASYSTDGVVWRVLGSVGVVMTHDRPVYVGIAVTSHDTSASTTAIMDSVRIEQ